MSPQTPIDDRPAEAAEHWHPGLAKAEASPVNPQELVEFPRCYELRAASGLSGKQLADRALVLNQVVFDLEHGRLASRTNARAVLRVLSESGASVGDEAAELVPHRFLPRCQTLRVSIFSLKRSRLAALAGVDAELVKGLEKGNSARLTEVMAVFQILRQYHRDVLRKDLDDSEIQLFPSDLPRPRLGPDGQGPTDLLSQSDLPSQNAKQALASSPPPVALSDQPDLEPGPEQGEQGLPPAETMPEAETAPTVPEARLDPGNEDGQSTPNQVPVPTPDAEEGIGQPDPTNRADVGPENAPEAAADLTEAAAPKVLGPENEGDPVTGNAAATEALGPNNEDDASPDNGPGPRGE